MLRMLPIKLPNLHKNAPLRLKSNTLHQPVNSRLEKLQVHGQVQRRVPLRHHAIVQLEHEVHQGVEVVFVLGEVGLSDSC